MKKKKIIIYFIMLTILFLIASLYYYYYIRGRLYAINPDGSLTPLPYVKYSPNIYTHIYAECETPSLKYKVIYTFENDLTINCRYIYEYPSEEEALKNYSSMCQETDFYANVKIDKNIVTCNDQTQYKLTKEHILHILQNSTVIQEF